MKRPAAGPTPRPADGPRAVRLLKWNAASRNDAVFVPRLHHLRAPQCSEVNCLTGRSSGQRPGRRPGERLGRGRAPTPWPARPARLVLGAPATPRPKNEEDVVFIIITHSGVLLARCSK